MTTTSDAAGLSGPAPARAAAAAALAAAALALAFAGGCRERTTSLHDGYYSSESMSYDQEGWKDYLTIYVNNGQITIVEYDARNLSGFRRSWDMDRMLAWNSSHGVRPTRYLLSYQNALLTLQDPRRIQPLPGGRNMYETFTSLAEAAIARSRSGDNQVAFVRLQQKRYPGEL
ncbi:MAG: FMN-binding protein [Deltaproteobacteria bacterium]|jgi:major membrane immunogen (membrane-anchored lipoprotein)|nr:FMN-binding protein [Deltaproteobacteria bacterium]